MIDLTVFDIPNPVFRNEEERQVFDAMVKERQSAMDFMLNAKKAVRYEPHTGKFFWLNREDRSKYWNAKHAGKEAGTINSHGYICFMLFGKTQKAHRLAWLFMSGEWPRVTDHINGVRTDNRIDNLRNVCDHKNRMNAGTRKDNTSGVTGVKRTTKAGRGWRADIKINRRTICLGTFESIGDAITARKAAEVEYFGDHRRK